MAGADELIREAQHAFQNVSPGSTDERKNIARAKKFATRVVKRFPGSPEAIQARKILRHFDVGFAPPASTQSGRPLATLANHSTPTRPSENAIRRFAGAAAMDDEWRSILQRFATLPRGKTRLLWIVMVFVFIFPLSLFGILALAIVYAFNPPLLKRHLLRMLHTLDSKP
ncbi:MAG: hypothetical protein HQ492_00365 [Woeseiaceae bacterium]|nr:hypothetical protein [Woeseiaceae bacterium]